MQMMFPGFPQPPANQSHHLNQTGCPQPLRPANPVVRGGGSRDAGTDGSISMANPQAPPMTSTTPPPSTLPIHNSGASPSSTGMQPQFQFPFGVQGGAPWPTWGDGSPMIPYSNINAQRGVPPAVQPAGTMVPNGSNLNLVEDVDILHVAPWEESKRSRQRRLQRLAKSAFKAKSSQWPMKIECDAEGKPNPTYRFFVHRVIRMVAKRWLDLSLIKFRDQSDNDIQLVRQEIDMRFTFTPPLREGYIMWHLEDAMRSSRYQWRNHWKNTGRGERHPQCPIENFPSLARYWVTKEAEEESRREKAHREEVKNARRILLENPNSDSEEVQNARQLLISIGDDDAPPNMDSNLT